jgi:hypothetical protein
MKSDPERHQEQQQGDHVFHPRTDARFLGAHGQGEGPPSGRSPTSKFDIRTVSGDAMQGRTYCSR